MKRSGERCAESGGGGSPYVFIPTFNKILLMRSGKKLSNNRNKRFKYLLGHNHGVRHLALAITRGPRG